MKTTLILICFLACSNSIFAGTGKGILQRWFKKDIYNNTRICVSNIIDSNVTVHITLYDQNGNIYNENTESNYDNITIEDSFSEDPTSTNGATLSANSTGSIVINNVGDTRYGYAIINWESTGNEQIALIGIASQNYDSGGVNKYGRAMIPINDNKPF